MLAPTYSIQYTIYTALLFNHFNLHYTLSRELTELYASVALRNFTLGLISIFEPIYLYLYFSQDISKTLLYFSSISLISGLLSPFAGKIVTKIGVKHSMLVSVPFLFLYYFGLWKIEFLENLFFILIPILITHNLFYWTAFHIDFARFSEKGKRGKQLSYLHTVSAVAAALSPFAGGIVLIKAGYPVLFGIVLILLFFSIVPLFLSREVHERYTDSYEKAFGEVFHKKYRTKAISFLAEGSEYSILVFIWPVFLYMLAISYSYIGLISSISLFAGLLFALYLGKLIDRMGHARILVIGSWMNALTWPVRMFVVTPLDVILINTLNSITRVTAHMPFGVLFYDWAGREDVNRDRFVIFREMTHNVGRGIILAIFAVIFLYIDNIAIAFPIAGVFSLMLMFFVRGVGNAK